MIQLTRFFLTATLLFFVIMPTFGQDNSLESIKINEVSINNPSTFNKTALRFLSEAQKKLIEQNWNAAFSLSENALVYDPSIADFYYIQAVSLFEKDDLSYKIIELLEKSLDKRSTFWYQYNKDSARLLLSKLYVTVKKPAEALALLDEVPSLFTSDAMLIRANANYVLKDVEEARRIVFEGASQYPLDTRFDELYYKYEYRLMKDISVLEKEDAVFSFIPTMQDFNEFFNARLEQFSRSNSNLMLYSAVFTDDDEERARLLRAWNIQGEKHPLYALYALQNNIMKEHDAFLYMLPFFENIDYASLQDFVAVLQDESVIELARNYFENYEGTVSFDTDGDLYTELVVQYKRGRPATVLFDENQDGNLSWEMLSDYGEPRRVSLIEESLDIEYSKWPYVETIIDNAQEERGFIYYLVDDLYSYPLIEMSESDVFKNTLSLSFYTPIVVNRNNIKELDVFNASYLIDFATSEYERSRVRYTLLDGIIKSALYTDNEMPYAYARFQNGIPVLRNIDKDRDGSFEVIEFFSVNQDMHIQEKLQNELFGFEHVTKGLYIQKILVDLNNDGLDDFTEEYVGNHIISSWDTDNDGSWNVQFLQNDDKTKKEVHYVHPLTNEIKSVLIEDGIPIFANGKIVMLDDVHSFYWIGENMGSSYAEKIITELSLTEMSIAMMVTDLLWNSEKEQFMRIVGLKNGDMYFGEVFYE